MQSPFFKIENNLDTKGTDNLTVLLIEVFVFFLISLAVLFMSPIIIPIFLSSRRRNHGLNENLIDCTLKLYDEPLFYIFVPIISIIIVFIYFKWNLRFNYISSIEVDENHIYFNLTNRLAKKHKRITFENTKNIYAKFKRYDEKEIYGIKFLYNNNSIGTFYFQHLETLNEDEQKLIEILNSYKSYKYLNYPN